MIDSSNKKSKKKIPEIKTFSVPLGLEEIKGNITINTNSSSQPSKEKIINQAFKFHSQGNTLKAKKYYQYFIDQGFKDYRVFSNYGAILESLGKLQLADLYTRKSIELKPDFADAHSNLGIILNHLGKLEEAELSHRKAVELKPDCAEVYSNLGIILNDLGKLQEAELSHRKAIELNPDFAEAYSNLGKILRDLGKLQEAELLTRKAIELNPDFADAHLNLGIILKDLNKLNEAEIFTRKAIQINPKFAGAYNNLGIILGKLGKTEESISSLKQALIIQPNDLKIYRNISFILRDYIWFTKNLLYKPEKSIEELIKSEKKKLKLKLTKVPLWFVDIPRTSSTSTQFHMWNNFGWPFGKRSIISNGKIIDERSLLMPNHTPAIIAKYLIGEKEWDTINSFTIVRDPYTWCVSLWQSELNDIPRFRYQSLSFLQFLHLLDDNLKAEFKERKIYHNVLRQSDYLLDEDGNILVKKILKFEEKKTIKSFLLDNNITFKESVHINKTKQNNHLISPSERKIIESLFAKDFEILGY